MGFRLLGAGLAFGIVGVVYTAHMIDRSMNYTTVQAQITGLESSCFLEKREFKRREWTDSRPCEIIEAKKAVDPQYADFTIERETKADVAFFSPVDHAVHHGTIIGHSSGDQQAFGGKHEGEVIEILAHTSEPDKVQEL